MSEKSKVQAVIFDTEVAGMERKEIIQLAWREFYEKDGGIEFGLNALLHAFEPSGPWELGAVATHGILPEDVKGSPPSADAGSVLPNAEYLIAHNVDFDCEAIRNTHAKRICTLALARECWPDLDSHTLTALVYHVCGWTAESRKLVRGAHDAASDVYMLTVILLAEIKHLGITTLEDLYQASEKARVPKRMPFGKHRGELIKDVPSGYVQWLLRQDGIDPYVKKAFTG